MNISIEMNTRDLQAAFNKAPAKTVEQIRYWIGYTSALVEQEEKKQVPVQTGRLQNSVHQVVNGVKAEVKPNVKYAIFVHEGVRGRKPNRFADRTYQIVKPRAERKADQIVRDLVRSI